MGRIARRIFASLALAALALPACRARRMPAAAAPALTSASWRCADLRLGRGLDLTVLGSGGPRSAGRAASSYLVSIDGTPRILVDVGPGSFARLGETHVAAEGIDTILLTHLHVDHAGDLPGIVKSRDLSADGPVSFRIFGPRGHGPYPGTAAFVDRLFGPEGAYAYLPSFRNELRLQPTELSNDVGAPKRVVLEEDGIAVSAVGVDHGDVPALAYRVDFAGRSVVFTGDLASKRGHIEDLARDAGVLVYDAAVLDPPGSPENLYELHTPPRRIGEVAAAARVRTLVLSHIPPAVEKHKEEVRRSIEGSFRGRVVFAEDCMHLPLGGGR